MCYNKIMSNKLRTEIDSRRKRDFCTTLAQRQLVTGFLRDGYDMAISDPSIIDEPFSITVHTADLPHKLTEKNRNYFSHEHALDELNNLFGRIAVNATIEIDDEEDDFIVTLLREKRTQS
jgi:hypothetical protein